MLSLITGDVMQSEPNLRVRWCMDTEDLVALRNADVSYVHVFFVIVYENGIEDRFLVSMDELMTHIQLRFPGNHLILAAVVWKNKPTDVKGWQKAEKKLLKKFNRNEYDRSILNIEKDEIELDSLARALHEYGNAFNRNFTAALRVNVPEGFFPKEPSVWVKRWVNLGYEYDFADQCQFRKRAAYAFTFKPFFMAAFLVLRPIFGLIAMIYYLGFGFRGVNPSVLLHPWRTSLSDLHVPRGQYRGFWVRNNSWFMEYADGRKKSKLWWLLNPFVLALTWLPLEVASRWTGMAYLEIIGHVFAVWRALPNALWLLIAAGIVVVVGALLFRKLINDHYASKQQQEALPEAQERKRQEQEETERLAFEEKVRVLTCEYVPKRQPSVADIPSQYRTVRLRFLEVKAMVCRPFAGH